MKKYKSFIPTLGAALLLSLGSAFCAQAADIGWVTEDGTWRYKDASGNYVTNTWKTSGGSSFYLGSDGKMTVNQWIDDEYYVNDSGAMVKNSWIHITEEGGSKPAGWYYTDSKGKLERDGWETIGTYKYAFDSDGRMRTGWFFDGDDIYYLGGENQGYAKPAGSVWITMKRTSPKMATFPKHAALPPIPPNGFTFSPTARQKGQMTVPTQSKPSMTGNIILMRTAL